MVRTSEPGGYYALSAIYRAAPHDAVEAVVAKPWPQGAMPDVGITPLRPLPPTALGCRPRAIPAWPPPMGCRSRFRSLLIRRVERPTLARSSTGHSNGELRSGTPCAVLAGPVEVNAGLESSPPLEFPRPFPRSPGEEGVGQGS
jgi:hypothetical protein